MKKIILLCGVLLVLGSGVATAARGVNLRWGDCIGDGGSINRNFACNTNTGNHVLVGSFELGQDILQASGNEVVVDLASAGPIPQWWSFKNVGTCRTASLSMNFVAPATAVNCVDWSSGQSAGGIGAYFIGNVGPSTARLVCALAVPVSALSDLFAGQEYFSYNFVINNQKTVGTGACAGCTTPVCLVFKSLKVTTQIAANDRTLEGPTNGTDSFYATWQGGAGVSSVRGTGCPAATPTRNKSWGEVKSLYR